MLQGLRRLARRWTMKTLNAQLPIQAAVDAGSSGRIRSLDLIKWMAIVLMVLDHLRAVWPAAEPLTVPGRMALPLFCLAMAANVARQAQGEAPWAQNRRYVISLIVFAVISQAPYQALFGPGLNIMWLLLPALLIAVAIHHQGHAVWLGVVGLVVTIAASSRLGYHASAVLIPAAMVGAITAEGWVRVFWACCSATLCVTANLLIPGVPALASDGEPFVLLMMGAAFVAPVLGLWLLRQRVQFLLPPVGRWGYLFYPAHLAAFALLRLLTH